MYDATIIGSCINCVAPGSLLATFVVVLIGAGVVAGIEMKKAPAKSAVLPSKR
jgi:glycerol uptake facilitator-like aquaporin